MNKVYALPVSVYRNASYGDCSNGGVSSKYDRLLLIGDGIEGCIAVDLDDEEAAKQVIYLERRNIWGKEYPTVYPIANATDGNWRMFGGNFVYTSDSRFPCDFPIPIHDRVE